MVCRSARRSYDLAGGARHVRDGQGSAALGTEAEGLEYPSSSSAGGYSSSSRLACPSLKLASTSFDLDHRRFAWPNSKPGDISKPMSAKAVPLLEAASRWKRRLPFHLRSQPADVQAHLSTRADSRGSRRPLFGRVRHLTDTEPSTWCSVRSRDSRGRGSVAALWLLHSWVCGKRRHRAEPDQLR